MSVKNKLDQLRKHSVVRYIAVGGSSYLIELGVIYSLVFLHVPKLAAVAIAFWVGLIVSFVLQKIVAFQNTQRSRHHMLWQALSYSVLVAVNYLFTLAFVALSEGHLGLFISRTLALIITTGWNYFIYKLFIFRKTPPITDQQLRALRDRFYNRKTLLRLALIIPIVAFLLPMLASGRNTLFPGDFDMQIQMTEAAKISITRFGQFPFWNPWVSGGVPLFADPQFGLFTPETLFSLFTTSVYAWKLTILVYFIVGFYAIYLLLHHILRKHGEVSAIILSYIWIFGSFFSLRSIGGHFTFLILTLLPLVIYLYLTIQRSKWRVASLGLVLAYCLNAAMHYSTIYIFIVLYTLWAVMTLLRLISAAPRFIKDPREYNLNQLFHSRPIAELSRLLIATVGAVILCSPRVYLTLQYLRDNNVSRAGDIEPYIGLRDGLGALFVPFQAYYPKHTTYGGFEASNYIGALTGYALFILFLTVAGIIVYRWVRKSFIQPPPSILALGFAIGVLSLGAFVVGLGGSRFTLLHHLPILSSMRVSTRFFFATALGIVILIALLVSLIREQLSRYSKRAILVVNIVLAAALVQVAYYGINLQIISWLPKTKLTSLATIQQSDYQRPPRGERYWMTVIHIPHQDYVLTRATIENRDQEIADNALVDTRIIPTVRCDEDDTQQYCAFVLTKNAKVEQWTPNSFHLVRTAPGAIRLNMNIGKHWVVNGSYPYKAQKTVDSTQTFTIPDSVTTAYTISYSPRPGIFK